MAELELNGVKKAYQGNQVVHGLDLAIKDDQFVVIVGPSGCGKSTLLRMIAGLEDITSGELAIDGEIVNDIDPADRGCAMVFQNYALYPHMTVRQNMAYPLKIARLPKAERERRVEEAARILDLTQYLDRRPAQLSGGQRQRVAMGRAIVREPKVFLFDEPLSNLDAKLRVQMRIEIRRLHKRLGATSIFVTHDQVEAMTLADLLVVMNAGHIEQVGRPSEIYRRPASVFVASFMGAPAMNLFDAAIVSPGEIALDAVTTNRIAAPSHDLAVGTRIKLGIRPEHVSIAAPGAPGLAARIDLVEELGGSQIAYCAVGEAEMAVVLPPDMEAQEGTLLTLALPPSALHIFDAASGKRLALETTAAAVNARLPA
ncbi:sn-glycerol-3-phosphate ABC transporter ATP-binding protein UgpC [Rhizobium mayense]|uniref:Sn-glycerol-3-phosphate ABC transporter ATP-binding protein UgpC n=1 Tax=Rhizobium mayense TaxID=1312184 RepID=A0ABT7JZV0_9HYPH|nr:sn-glycerol-3-phosphate ABC transporter ATP-binding protein UgpC [Rhizobium mayense]MDL2401881.1 sn-glycerol-3-phosphate ABC transporter ATP-binding protein UgpC [Rhizobium mayense]